MTVEHIALAAVVVLSLVDLLVLVGFARRVKRVEDKDSNRVSHIVFVGEVDKVRDRYAPVEEDCV